MEQSPNNNPENIEQNTEVSSNKKDEFELFDKEKAQQLRDEYHQNHSEESYQKENSIGEYQTPKEAHNALKSVEGQLYWGRTLGLLSDAISMPDATQITSGGDPKWKAQFTGSNTSRPRGESYSIEAVVNDEYDKLAQNGEEKIASSDNKRFLIEPDYGYTKTYFIGEKAIDIDGFYRMSRDGEFPEETDFTVENKTKNHDIPNRINKVLYELFGKNEFSQEEKDMLGSEDKYFGHLDHVEYPDENTLKNAHKELRSILDDIGSIDELENKHHLLEMKVQEFEEIEEEAKNQEVENKNRQELSAAIGMVNNGDSLNLDNIRILFDDKYDNDLDVLSARKKIGIDENVLKQLLNGK